MSNPRAKAERSKAKDLRQGVREQKPGGNRNKRARPVMVLYRIHAKSPLRKCMKCSDEWAKWRTYRTTEEAQKAVDAQLRKYPTLYEFEIQ
jgi:hypothetical protein